MRIYDIILNTPIGKKTGELKAKIENGKLHGTLSLLGRTEEIHGTVDDNGKCSLKGKFVTLLKTIDFTADGTINWDGIRLNVMGGGTMYDMIGALRHQDEIKELQRKEQSE